MGKVRERKRKGKGGKWEDKCKWKCWVKREIRGKRKVNVRRGKDVNSKWDDVGKERGRRGERRGEVNGRRGKGRGKKGKKGNKMWLKSKV